MLFVQTDNTTKLIVDFLNFANAPKKGELKPIYFLCSRVLFFHYRNVNSLKKKCYLNIDYIQYRSK